MQQGHNPFDQFDSAQPVYGAAPKPPSPPSGYAPADKPVTPLTYVPGGPDDPTKTPAAPSGFRYKPDGKSLEPIPNGPADTALDDGTATLYAQQYIQSGQLPPLGMGGSGMRRQIMQKVGEIAGAQGMSGGALATQITHFKAQTGNIQNLQKQLGTVEQNEATALANGQQFLDRSAELPGQTQYPIINSVVQTAQRNLPVPGHEAVSSADVAYNTFVNEYAKVISGSPNGSGILSDSARREAMDMLRSNASLTQKQAAFAQMKADMANRIAASHKVIQDSYHNLTQKPGYEVPSDLALLGAPASGGSSGPPPPPMGGGAGGPPNDPMAPSGGGTKDVLDPSLTPVRREYMARLQAGQSPAQMVTFLRQSGVSDPALLRTAVEQATFRQKNPNVPIGRYDTSAIDHITQQMGMVNRAVNAVGQTDVGAGAIAAGNAMLGGFGPEVVGAFGGNKEQARLAGQYSAQDHPDSALIGTIAGGTAAALGGEAALGRAGMEAGFGRSLLADSGYGAAAGAGASPDNRLSGAVEGGLAGAAGSIGGQAVAKGASAVFRGVTDKSVNALADSAIPLTVGQTVGKSGRAGAMVKGVEDRLSGFSSVGDMIKARQAEGYHAVNSAAFDKALEPINANVGGKVGEEAVANARQAVSEAFSAALKGKQAVPDQQFIQAARGPLERLASIKRNDLGPEIVQQIEESTRDLFDPKTGALSGENMQAFMDALRQIKQSYKNDPLYPRTIKPAMQGLESSVTGMFARQAPEVMPQFNAAKAAYRRLSVLADAVDRGKSTEGVFTPAQLGMADRANAKKFDGKLSSASGESPFFGLQRAAQNVLPSKVPDSGTAGRLAMLALPGSLTGAGAGLGYLGGDAKGGAETGLGLTGILALAYTKTGQRRIAQMLLSRNPAARALAEKITQRVPIAGAAGTALVQTGASR